MSVAPASCRQGHRSVGTVRVIAVSVVPVVGMQVAVVVGSCRRVWVSKDALTPAIAVLVDSFTSKDFEIDCDGCTACCRGHDGVKLDAEDVGRFRDVAHQDEKGEWRLNQIDGACVYLVDRGCSIHADAPRRCKEFDCRAAVITYSAVGIDELVKSGGLPLAVVEMGRTKLEEFNNVMNTRALSGGADLSFLMEGDDDAG